MREAAKLLLKISESNWDSHAKSLVSVCPTETEEVLNYRALLLQKWWLSFTLRMLNLETHPFPNLICDVISRRWQP